MLFALVGAGAVVVAIRRPRRANVDAALLFAGLALVVLVGQVSAALGVEPSAVQRVATSGLVLALPFLLLRLVNDFAGVPRSVMRLAILGLGASVVGIALLQGTLPPPFTLFLVLYFAAVQTYGSFVLVRESRRATGVNRRRMRAASAGSVLLGLAVLSAGAALVAPVPQIVTRLVVLGSAIAYVLAFVPPAALRRAWQEPDLRAFLERVGATHPTAGLPAIVAELEGSATAVMGARTAAIFLWGEREQALRASHGDPLRPGVGTEGEAFSLQRPVLATDAPRRYPELAARYRALGASAVAAAPVSLHGQHLGVLAVYMHRPSLFADDDLELLELVARQVAVVLDGALAYDVLHRSSAARLSLVFERVPVILYTYAVEEEGRFRYTSVNPAFLAATGLAEDAVVGRLVEEIVPEPSLSLVLAKYREAIRERATVRWIETTTYPSGTMVADVTITPIFDDAGRCSELFGTVYDLTEIEQVKQELRASEAQKEELALLNRRLEEATQAKSEFLANMSHELRTPLNAILGFSDLLTEQLAAQISASQQRYLRNVRESGEHLLGLINDVLDLSKVEAGRLELRAEVVRVAPLLEPVVASARASADAAGLAFEAVVPEDGVIRVDPARLRQVLYNLLSNAVKFTPRGSVRLVVRFDGVDLVIEVADTGLGIPESARRRVFGTFERLHEGRVEATGTGLGLALTKRLVELHRGSIGFASGEGEGTTFRVVLPEARVEPVHGDRVLVVEDGQADADLIVALAAEAALASEVVTTAQAAIDAARADPPRGIVLDLRLPDERGERVLEALQADPRTRAIPVIVVTVEDDEGRSRPLGADDHLTKPIDRQRLVAWLRSLKDP